MAFLFFILVFFIDHYCGGESDKHCLLSFFSFSLSHSLRHTLLLQLQLKFDRVPTLVNDIGCGEFPFYKNGCILAEVSKEGQFE